MIMGRMVAGSDEPLELSGEAELVREGMGVGRIRKGGLRVGGVEQ